VTQKQGKSAKNTRSTQTNKGHLTTVDIEHFKQLLLRKHQEIVGNVSEIEGEALKASDGDISNMPIYMADAGTDNYEQEFALGLMDNERKLLREIENV